MSWRDDFNDGSLDTTKFGTSVAGDGAVAEPAGETLNITMGAAAANAAIAYCKDIINTGGEFVYTVRHKIDGTPNGGIFLLDLYDGVPAVGTNTVVGANCRVNVLYVTGAPDYIYITYLNTAGTTYYWNGSVWSTSSGGALIYNISEASWIDVSFMVKDGKWRISVIVSDNARSLLETSPVAFSALKAYTNLYLFWGEAYTNYYYVTSMKTDFFRYDDQTPIYGWYNGGTSGADYKIGRCISYDGGDKYLRHPGVPVISPLTGESAVFGPHVINVSGTLYMFYTAYRSADPYITKRRIRLAHSTDNGEVWTDDGYITTPGDVGTWDAAGHAFPVVAYDSVANNFKMYVGGVDAPGIYRIGLFTADTITGVWTPNGGNPVITIGAGGSWNEIVVLPFAIEGGSNITLWVNGSDSALLYKVGKYISTDWVSWTPDGSNPIIVRDATKTTAASNIALYATAVVVTNSTPFSVNDPIVIRDSGYRHLNRVLSIPDSTHINLWYHSPHAYTTPVVTGLNHDNLGMGNLTGSLAFLTTWFQSGQLFEKVSRWEYSGGVWVYKPLKSPPLSTGQVWDIVSSENLKWVQAEITLTPEIQGDIALSLSPGSTSIVEYICQGAVSLTLTPQAATIADYVFSGTVLLDLLPNSEYAQTVFVVQGNISVSLSPQSIPIADYPFQGDLSLSLTPNTAYVWEKIVQGAVDFILLPSAIMQIDISILIQGDIDISFLLAALIEYLSPDFSYETLTEKTFPSPSGIYDFEIETTKTFPAPDGIYPFKPEMVN